MTIELSKGVCEKLARVAPGTEDPIFQTQPLVQFLSIKRVPTTGGAQGDRYRIILSDGVHFVQSMLATQLNSLVDDGSITRYSVARLDNFTVNLVQQKRLTIILGLEIVSQPNEKIGEPVNADAVLAEQGNQSPAAVAPPAEPVARPPVQQVRNTTSNGGEKPPTIYPIEHLSPYNNKWTIKARVVQKSDLRHWSNSKGEGKLISLTLMDETGEIKATAFNGVADEVDAKVVQGGVYFISRARVNLAKKKFSNVQNEYELSFEKGTEIVECIDKTDVPMIKYNFVSLGDLGTQDKDSVCDVIAVLKDVGDLGEIVSKTTQRTIPKRELVLVDPSGYSCRLTLWGKQAQDFNGSRDSIIAFKGVKVGDFGGRSLSAQSSSTMTIDPDVEEAHKIRGWFEQGGSTGSFQTHSGASGSGLAAGNTGKAKEVITIGEVKERGLGQSDKTDYFTTCATTMHIKPENLAYPACPTDGCNKKVIEIGDQWRCEKCDKSYDRPEYRYIISMAVADQTEQAWLQGFNDVGTALFGVTANVLMEAKDSDEKTYQRTMRKGLGKRFVFECRARTESFNDIVRIRYGIMRLAEVDTVKETEDLLATLRLYN